MKTSVLLKIKLLLILSVLIPISELFAQRLISTEIVGNGQPIILIHGMSSSKGVWDETVERYQSQYELHLVSIKGFGNKEIESSEHILAQIKNEVIQYVKDNTLTKPILIGHSMGGFLGLWAAAEEPDLFGKIVSVDGVPYFPVLQMPGITPETAQPMVDAMKAQFANSDENSARATQEMIVSTMIATDSKREKVVQMGIDSNPEVIGQAYGEMFLTDIRDKVSEIKIPVLVFGAWAAYKNYGATKESVASGYKSQLANIENVTFLLADKAYHFVFYDEPDWFYDNLDEFIATK
ncbi:alpha/beta hydrolase fold protein [Indibacter alkaliphilus LW1]|uniref:Alpha/beta hydrolase fold protein n=1 Tax=Indibacter alkaliphilus (strain CCUG 57479 / KCTC 22604 / LW1) TaxID=1189612 RepID=S2DI31_INDAL|nr:alpha/beta hydrolase [Indibacter alkaliphilus]EOZ98662.1 alpha/beta hydrolase fold protein [Indibacter alkaliphilus LW1]